MGREVRRVSLDFDWPIGKVWAGYISPYSLPECPWCESGWSPLARRLQCESGVGGDWWYRRVIEEHGAAALTCPRCGGSAVWEGVPEAIRKAADEWEGTDPPAGDGWQLWETVSEGAPVSPVFATAEELAERIVADGQASSIDVALRFIDTGRACSVVVSYSDGVVSGLEFAGRHGIGWLATRGVKQR